ncbi:MAG: hypothetical protein J6K32_09305 [Clostridia bacterium]|nr:hypothetical protein [Clostridia bacterium]
MRRLIVLLILTAAMLCASGAAQADTRALLVACSDFITQPDLGSAVSGNLHMIASALIGASPALSGLSIEDGSIGSSDALRAAVDDAFAEADEDDLSLLYLCTHGILSSADDGQCYLLLGDGEQESLIGADELFSLLSHHQGEKLLIVDACYSGALIGRGGSADLLQTPAHDPSIHVLTSAGAAESSWYYDSQGLPNGAQSYFASAFAAGLGLYDAPEADANGDGSVSLGEMHRYLRIAVPSSSAQLLSADPEMLMLPAPGQPMLSRPLSGFTYGSSLLRTDSPVLEFSFTAAQESAVQYRLIEYTAGQWDWENAQVFLDEGDDGSLLLSPGRKRRTLSLDAVQPEDSGYLMLQIFSVAGDVLTLCSERLIAVQPAQHSAMPQISVGAARTAAGEIPVYVTLDIPAELTVSVRDHDGKLVRRLCAGQLTRPSADGQTALYWDGCDREGNPAAPGAYSISVDAMIGGGRRRADCELTLSP